MRNTIIVLLLFFGQCSTNDKKFILIDSELNDSRLEYEQKNNRILDCIRMGIRMESNSDSLKDNNEIKDLFQKLNQISITKDSLIKVISPQSDNDDLIGLLEKLKVTVIELHKPKYPTKDIEFYFDQDLKFIRENIETLPREMYLELFKHIIERWTNECYTSFLQSWAIDYPC
ncbi:MAG: hypothetical protein KF803_12115 [Cyclobacteriaceae bacterium]|nr:hypothetical protein [Cyclobacteriaceae bacterium]